jgi:hypothetical protein
MLDKWTIYASSGEHQEQAEYLLTAVAQFMATHPDDYVSAVVVEGMQPPLALATE